MIEELQQLHQLAGGPSLAVVVRHAQREGHGTSKSTLSNLLHGKPTRPEAIEAFVAGCSHYARTRHPPIPLPHDSIDLGIWRRRYATARSADKAKGVATRTSRAAHPGSDAVRAERLRDLLETLVKFAIVLERVCLEKGHVVLGEDEQQRDERHRLELVEGERQIGEAIPKLLIESGSRDIVEAHGAVYRAGARLLRSWDVRRQYPGSVSRDEHRRLTDDLHGAVVELQERAQAALAAS